LIFTDTHAELNGHSAQDIKEYFEAIDVVARKRGFESSRLSELVHAAEAENVLCDEEVPADILLRLSQCAAKWYRGGGGAKEGATRYYKLNLIEKQALELAFPHVIFITFNGSKYRSLFPDTLPVFYMYSLRRGVSVKPWFLPPAIVPA